MQKHQVLGWMALAFAGFLALAAALGVALMLLWNWLMPEIFGLPVISYWQALGLLALTHLLFKGGLPRRPPIEHFGKQSREPPATGESPEHRGQGAAPAGAPEP
jgi:hypothetical protein